MKALVCIGPPDYVDLRDVEDPFPEPDEAVVKVSAVSVNRGELHRLKASSNFGWRPGWGFAGVVERSRGSGVAAGTRVMGMVPEGGWAERVAIPARHLAPVPGDMAWECAAAIPVAGLTALRCLRLGGDLAGRSVLVLAAGGCVGRFAVQLARRAGADVTAVANRRVHAARLKELGATIVTESPSGLRRRYDLVLESVGGESLSHALRLVAPRGTVVTFGNSARADRAWLAMDEFYPLQATLRGFHLLHDLFLHPAAQDLRELARLVDQGTLAVDPGEVVDWTEASSAIAGLDVRRVSSRLVLRVGDEAAFPVRGGPGGS